jgi:uncharacterized protein (DUF1697 family)
MRTYLAFLRAVNVGGTGMIAMARLRTWLADLGFHDPQTLLQSGNLVFRGSPRSGAALETQLEHKAQARLSLTADFFVRTLAEWEQVITRNPFPKEAKDDPSHLVVFVLKKAPTAACVTSLRSAIKAKGGRETVGAQANHLYAYYPNGQGRSKLTLSVIEKHLGLRGTGRNWNTVLKMAALATA